MGRAAGRSATWVADNGNGTFTNPLFFDEFSDPDLIRVGSDFYLTGIMMHSMAGLPVLHSRDLVNWTCLSYALDKLDLGPSFRLEDGRNEYGRGIWASCLRYHKGTFYIFSNVKRTDDAVVQGHGPQRSLDEDTDETIAARSVRALRRWVYVVSGYRGIRIAQLTADLTDTVPFCRDFTGLYPMFVRR